MLHFNDLTFVGNFEQIRTFCRISLKTELKKSPVPTTFTPTLESQTFIFILTDFFNDWVDSAPYITLSVIAIHSLSKGGFRWAAVTGWKHRENIEELPYPWPFAIAGAYTFGHQPNMWNCMKVMMETQTLLVRLWPLRAKADVDPKTIITDQSISMQYKDRAFRFKVKFKFQSFHRPRMRCTDLYSGPICLHYNIVERTKTRWIDILSAISTSQSFFNHQFYI